MIDTLVRGALGTAGSQLLDFYIQNNLWINVILFVYALLVVFARRNYFQVAQFILADFIREQGDNLAKKSPTQIRGLLLKWKIPWENGMQAGWFPFISTPRGILLYLKSGRTFKKIFPVEVLVEAVLQQTSTRSS